MNFDIVEAIRQKQSTKRESLSIENGDVVDISITEGKVVICAAVPPERRAEEEVDPSEIARRDD